MEEAMSFPETWEEFEKMYGFTDDKQEYTNGSRLIQSFRVEQWLEHIRPIEDCKEPERKKGKWIQCDRVGYHQFHPDYSSFYSVFRCTSCLKENDRTEKYCPNCGAEMEKA